MGSADAYFSQDGWTGAALPLHLGCPVQAVPNEVSHEELLVLQEHGANWIATDHPLDWVHSVQDHGQQAPLNQLQIQRTLQCSLNLLKQITFTPARMNCPRRSRGKGFSQARSILTIQEPKEFEKQIRRWHLYCPKVSYVSRHRPL